MSVNLLDLAKSSLTPILISKAGSLFGLDEGIASKALGAVLPTLLSGVLNKSSTPQGADSLLNAIKDDSVDSNIVNNLSSLLGSESGVQTLGTQGGKLLGFLFGDKASGLGEQIASIAGVSAESSTGIKGLTALAAPALFGLLKNQVLGSNLNASGLSALLANQIPYLEKALPAQVAQWLGWGSLGSFFGGIASKFGSALGAAGSAATAATTAATAVGSTALDTGKKSGGILKWLIPLLLLGAVALWALRSCGAPKPHDAPPPPPPAPTAGATPAAPPAPPAAPAVPFDAKAAIAAAQGKYDAALKALEGSGKCDAPALANALSLYVVNFASGSAALPIGDVAELKKAVPALKLCAKDNVKLVVVGHTDNVGNPAANQKLSEARANALKALFVGQGLSAAMFTASGKGDTEPVGDNKTEEGKFKNRRISYSAM